MLNLKILMILILILKVFSIDNQDTIKIQSKLQAINQQNI